MRWLTPATSRLGKRLIRSNTGAVTVEAAIVVTLVFFLLIMVFQGGLFMRSHLSATDAAASGARAGAVVATDGDADFKILQAVKKSTSPTARSAIVSIVIFKAQAPDFGMPAYCKSTPGPDCNVYSGSDLLRPQADFGAGGWAGDDNWPAASRTAPAGTSVDIGVYIQLKSGTIEPLPQLTAASEIAALEPA